jgi:hypothetical protein
LKGLLALICISLGTRISEGNKVAMVYSPMTYQVACFYGGSAAPVVLSLQASHIYITSCVLSVCADHVSWKHGHGVILMSVPCRVEEASEFEYGRMPCHFSVYGDHWRYCSET